MSVFQTGINCVVARCWSGSFEKIEIMINFFFLNVSMHIFVFRETIKIGLYTGAMQILCNLSQ